MFMITMLWVTFRFDLPQTIPIHSDLMYDENAENGIFSGTADQTVTPLLATILFRFYEFILTCM